MIIGIDVRALMHGRTSGVENYIRSLLKALFEIDSENQYVLFYNSRKECQNFLPPFDGRRVKVARYRYPNKLLHLLWRFFKYPKIDKIILRKIGKQLDVLFVPDPRPSPVSKSVKKVTTFHDLVFERYPQHFSWKSRLWFAVLNPREEVRSSTHLIAVSEFTKRELQELYCVEENKITVIPEAVPGKLKPEKDIFLLKTIREKYALPENFFLTFSTLEPRKNLESVSKAYGIFQKKSPLETYRLVLAGRRDPLIFGKVFIDDHPDILLPGFIDEADKAGLYTLASGMIFVSTYEGFGLPVLEAMACGTPVIASNTTSIPEVTDDAAILVDPYDSEKIAEAMEKLTRPEIHEEYRQKGLQHVKQFSWLKAAKKTLKVFNGEADEL
ncbi:MAG: hypothetical protein UT55_C0076G0005 [Candidatus Peregrinibacteria bacterium GW2011_GWE2_39_6]|nr:MAG: hypothetical protein UT36_C0007G0034 [Candidatus Peregrinibacteria bacterium GW2011_GWF2_39_17]KKR24049.1 MAG: hypothetical protein UT55_C0076G0005 [Candidatus Peregrinibacteria bacterium GW2011_GWE2_39_6]HCW31899.1 hypothetical protein [Candidatus Peregrinibacteria bacterium]